MAKREKSEPKSAGGLPFSAQCRVVMLIGPDAFKRQQRTHELKGLLAAAHGEIDVVHYSGETAQAADVLDECRSFGLMTTHKMVVLDEAESLIKEDTRPAFQRYAESPCESATLVIRSKSLVSGNLGKAVEKVGRIEPCEPPTDLDARAWVAANAAPRHAVTIDKDAVDLLLDRVGPDLSQLDTELAKLAVACGENKRIDRPLVESFVGKSRDEEIWSIQTKLLTTGAGERLAEIRHLMDVNRTPGTLIIWAVNDMARKLHSITRVLKAGGNPYQMGYKLRLFGGSDKVFIETARTMEPLRALNTLRAGVDADRRIKSGLADADRAAEIAVLRLPRGPARA